MEGACGSPPHYTFTNPPDKVEKAYNELICMIIDMFHLNLDETQHISKKLSIITTTLSDKGYENLEMISHPLFNIDVSQYAEDEKQKIIDLDNAVGNIKADANDDEETRLAKKNQCLELTHCMLQTANIAGMNKGCYPEMYENHYDWSYTIAEALSSHI
jgi:hypothetical protein